MGSASDALYKKMFALYNSAPGASKVTRGSFSPSDALGCAGFKDSASGLGINAPCAGYFQSTRSRPSQAALVSAPLDSNLRGSDRAFVRFQYDGGHSAILTDPINPVFDNDYTQPWWQAQLIETHTFDTSAANQFLVAGTYFAPIFRLRNPSKALEAFPTTLNFNAGTFNTLGGGDNVVSFPLGRYNTQYQLSEDVVKTWRNHKLGFGASISRTLWSELPNKINAMGLLTVQNLAAFYNGGVDPADPANNFTQLVQSFTSQSNLPIAFFNFGLYGQDEWHARTNLTITVALRAEHYSDPVCRTRCFARLAGPFDSVSHDPDQPYNQAILTHQNQALLGVDNILWSPRFSFAWQHLGVKHNAVVRGGIGIFYDPLPGRALDFSHNPPLLNSYSLSQGNLAPDETTSLFKEAAASNAAFLNGFAASETLAQLQALDP